MANTADMQAHIRRIQALYREWMQIQTQLAEEEALWQRSTQIMQELNGFYFDGDYRTYAERIEDGEAVDLGTEGEYSVMSEDALWNAFYEQQQLAWRRLRSALAVLDRDGEPRGRE